MKKGEGDLVAYIQIDQLPEYKMCLLKKGIVTNDEEIFESIKQSGVTYYKYYAIIQDGKEKFYVSTFKEAENILKQLKEKKSRNKDLLSYKEIYSTELKDFVTTDKAVADLYLAPIVKKVSKIASSTTNRGFSTSRNISYQKPSLGISFIKPVSGTITSRVGHRSSIRSGAHTGLDIAASHGTPIKAAASGTVVFSGRKGSYGNLVILSHGNGVQTYYAHCSSINVSTGQSVSQGQVVGRVGSTGNSTGNHLHLEVRQNGVVLNPEYYIY